MKYSRKLNFEYICLSVRFLQVYVSPQLASCYQMNDDTWDYQNNDGETKTILGFRGTGSKSLSLWWLFFLALQLGIEDIW